MMVWGMISIILAFFADYGLHICCIMEFETSLRYLFWAVTNKVYITIIISIFETKRHFIGRA